VDNRVTNLGNTTTTNLGGGSTYNTTTGEISAPTYTVNNNAYHNVGDAFTAVDGRLTYFDNRLNTQQATIENNTQRIKQLETWQGTTNTKLAALQNGIDATGAMSAAMTQVQPKLSEKMRNQISAGIGFYRDSTAVALGYSHIGATGDKAATVSISVSDRGDLMGGGGMTIGW
jgi:autotransporter adhesin